MGRWLWQEGLSYGLQVTRYESSPVNERHTPHQMAFRFAHMLPLEHFYQCYIHFVRVLLNASANGKMVVQDTYVQRCSPKDAFHGNAVHGFRVQDSVHGFRVQGSVHGFRVMV